MTRTYTNLTWPDDPYRTGQQLYRRPPPRLAAFRTRRPGGSAGPIAAAVVYLPLHRTRPRTVSAATLSFGFRAVTAVDQADATEAALIADLDLLQARRHAAVVAGYHLAEDLAMLHQLAGDHVLRGLNAVAQEWADRSIPASGRASMIDCGLDLAATASLEEACWPADLRLPAPASSHQLTPDIAAQDTVQRALAIALIAARHLGRYTWDEPIDVGAALTSAAWDCFSATAGAPGGP